jgi:hypothetical protein
MAVLERPYDHETTYANKVCRKALMKNPQAKTCTDDCPFSVCQEELALALKIKRENDIRADAAAGVSVHILAIRYKLNERSIQRIIR